MMPALSRPVRETTSAPGSLAIEVAGVSKKFCRSLKKSIFYGIQELAESAIGRKASGDVLREAEFWSLKDVSFGVAPGECLGIIGHNGAGKSTLLKLLNGIIPPDQGRIEINGRVGALIEVGAGFHPLLSGYENIDINGAILGMSRREVASKKEAIIEFAGLPDEALKAPVKTYSSGMHVRLGFAIAAHTEPDVLLVDEVLAVGDAAFRSKCYTVLAALLKKGTSIVVVSHDMLALQVLCSRCLWLNGGRIQGEGNVPETISQYVEHTHERLVAQPGKGDEEPADLKAGAKVAGVEFLNAEGRKVDRYLSGEEMRVRIRFVIEQPIAAMHISFSFRSADGEAYSGCYTKWDGQTYRPPGQGEQSVTVTFPQLLLGSGIYTISVALREEDGVGTYDWRWGMTAFRVHSDQPMIGKFELPHQWTLQ